MDKIDHTTVTTNGINMHVASIGTGPAILFLHGFPELWYSWRHQLVDLSSKGYRCIAPDLRGYGDTDAPESLSSYTILHIVGDLVGLLDALGLDQVFLVGHDWGAMIAWNFCLFRPDRIKALVNTSVQYLPRNPAWKPIETFRAVFGDDFYMCRFQEPGETEEAFAHVDTAKLIKGLLSNRDPSAPRMPKGVDLSALPEPALPSWLSEDDINYYASKFSKKGFTGPLNYYRNIDKNWELTAPWTAAQIKVPAKFIVGDQDLTYHFPGAKEYIHSDRFKNDVPNLQEMVLMEGVAHFLNQEKANEVSAHIYDFIKKF